jgi:hypothetical protein
MMACPGVGGGQDITFPFSPGDKGGQVYLGESKNSLARYLTKAGVDARIATKVNALSVSLFVNMDDPNTLIYDKRWRR